MSSGDAINIRFGPRLVHRVRFAPGAFRDDSAAISRLFDAGERPRLLAFVDSALAHAAPGIVERVERSLARARCVEFPGRVRVVAGGEAVKNDPGHVEVMLREIHDAKLCRRSYVMAVGGGAMLDAAGYAAAIAHRGVRLIRVPTTTLAQADSCVAVKCGVNGFGKKNYLGVFAAPWAVVLDSTLLETLSDRDWRSGFSEAVKVGLVKDAWLFRQIRTGAKSIAARDMATAWPIVQRSAEIHLRHITEGGDPFELETARPLDYGHWAAHRLETMTEYRLRHGEAVAIGIAIDTEYSRLKGFSTGEVAAEVRAVLEDLCFTLADPALADRDGLLAGLEEFREHLGGRLAIAMVRGVGAAFDVGEIDRGAMGEAIASVASWKRTLAGSEVA